ncbi:uncharacterized protein LOC112563148 [Pomacea canaliculata]|uniref:uncharacterized protein LOC112563148 n=1 Tax=Pomacea canaliculata TaxID=400727 RepID=UPI000D729003|nr:uncharacterized protein LOC112563148 [Pomacea canaliculata]
MHIHHMFGMLFQRRVAKYTGRNPEDGPQQPTNAAQFQERLDEIVQNANKACSNFMLCREYTPRGHEDCYQYINEINVRLQTCEFVRRFFKGGMPAYLSERKSGQNVDFIRESVTEIEDLIMECYNVVLLHIHDISLQKAVLWYADLFHGCSDQLRALVVDDSLSSRRFELIAKKLEFSRKDNFTCVDASVSPEKIASLVQVLESIFDHEKMYNDSPKCKIELDYKDWLMAIRNPCLQRVYTLEEVVARVRHWHESVRSPQSSFYLFILLSLLGFGSVSKKGNNESLLEAQMLREEMQKLSKLVVRPRCPREWLGTYDSEDIRRLVSNNAVGHVDNRRIKNGYSRAKLAVCKGTICPKNKKVAGEINLDLGENCTPVHVFYVPSLVIWKVHGM